MNVENIALSDCTEGDILASDIYNMNGVVLVAKDTVLNEYIKEKLISMGISNVQIYQFESLINEDDINMNFRKSYSSSVQQMKSLVQEVAAGKPLDLVKLSNVTDEVYSNINENECIKKCLLELRETDDYTYTHCINVAFYSMLIANWLKLSRSEIMKAIQSGLLHDIGKIKIPDAILNKKGKLTEEEFDVIKQHTILGYDIVKEINNIDHCVKLAILLHHERMDGSGYPYHCLSDKINQYTKIVSLADVFDAMTSDRVYKKRSTPFEAFKMFQTMGISMFDIPVIDIFVKNLAVYITGAKVYLSNGEIGEIVYVPIQNITAPIIRVSSGYLDYSKEKSIQILYMI